MSNKESRKWPPDRSGIVLLGSVFCVLCYPWILIRSRLAFEWASEIIPNGEKDCLLVGKKRTKTIQGWTWDLWNRYSGMIKIVLHFLYKEYLFPSPGPVRSPWIRKIGRKKGGGRRLSTDLIVCKWDEAAHVKKRTIPRARRSCGVTITYPYAIKSIRVDKGAEQYGP